MFVGKLSDVGHSVSYLSANGVVECKCSIIANVFFYVFHYASELVQRFCGL